MAEQSQQESKKKTTILSAIGQDQEVTLHCRNDLETATQGYTISWQLVNLSIVFVSKSVEVYGVYRKTEYDGQRSFYRDLLWKCYPERLAPGMEVRETATWGGSERERWHPYFFLNIRESLALECARASQSKMSIRV